MRLLILGAGGTGGYFGARLAAAGVDVTFLVRAARASRLRAHGLILRSPLGDIQRNVQLIEARDAASQRWDVVILACKAYDLDDAIATILPAVRPDTKVLPLLNGVRHLDELKRKFRDDQILGGLCHIGVRMAPDGAIEHLNEIHHFAYGARIRAQSPFCDALEPTLAAGGFSPTRSSDIVQDMWEKWTMLTAYAAVTCLFRAPIGDVLAAGGREHIESTFAESIAISSACGFVPRADFVEQSRMMLTESGSRNTSSMLRDILAGNQLETEHIFADFLARGIQSGINAPLLSLALVHLRTYERQRCNRQAQAI